MSDFSQRPLLVFWEVTRACPLACRHCRADAIHDPLPGELSTEDGVQLIRSLRAFGPRPPVLVLTGGDPLCRSDLFDLLEVAHDEGVRVALSPAVSDRLTSELVDALLAAGVNHVSISLDGAAPATHDSVRGVPGHHAKTLAAIDLLVGAGMHVQVNTTVMQVNAQELAALAELLVTHGVAVWEVFFLIQVGRAVSLSELSADEVEDVAHFLVDAAGYGVTVRTVEAPSFRRVVAQRRERPAADPVASFGLGNLAVQLLDDLHTRLGPPSGPPRVPSAGTRDGKGIVFVGYDGTVSPAGFLPIDLGNVRERPLAEIYRDHPLLQAIRSADFSGKCGRCPYADPCGGSRARAFVATGDPLGDDPACPFEVAAVA
ncbi:MAG: TIGR04053 family radical SAM/SPASM domain-containing protein [Nitriliruptoraceae bacterium]